VSAEDCDGVPCPVCPARFDRIGDGWQDHLAAEHPATLARLDAAAAAREWRGSRVRMGIWRDLERENALAAQVRERQAAAAG
jgi:hypothetical protein